MTTAATTTPSFLSSWFQLVESTEWLVLLEGAWILAWPWLLALFLGFLVGRCLIRPVERKLTGLEQQVMHQQTGSGVGGVGGEIPKIEETLATIKEMLVVITNMVSSSSVPLKGTTNNGLGVDQLKHQVALAKVMDHYTQT